jgi:hypothetical protein
MRSTLVLTIVLVLLCSPQAFAATASVAALPQSQHGLIYTAAPGERNRVMGGWDLATPYPYEIVLRDAGAVVLAGPGCRSVDEHTVRCPSAAYPLAGATGPPLSMIVDVADGDDAVTLPTGYFAPVQLRGGDGADVLTGQGDLFGGTGNDVLTGGDEPEGYKGSGPPAELLVGGPGDDVLHGGDGNDVLRGDGGVAPASGFVVATDPGGGNDVIDGGGGEDTVLYNGRTAGVRVDLADSRGVYGSPGERDRVMDVEHVTGGDGDDVLLGNMYRNRIEGGPGDDRIVGRDGWDRLSGGDGDDVLDGRAGSDDLDGGPGRDTLRGGIGDDDLVAGGNGDSLDGGRGHDSFFPGRARALRCGSGRDVVARPAGALLGPDCETVILGVSRMPANSDSATVTAHPRRLRDGRLRFSWFCDGSDGRCDMRLVVRLANGTTLGRRSVAILGRGETHTIDIRPRRSPRLGAVLEISVSGVIYEFGARQKRYSAHWRTRA